MNTRPNNTEPAVNGAHCQGDVAVRMGNIPARQRGQEYAQCLLVVCTLVLFSFSSARGSRNGKWSHPQ